VHESVFSANQGLLVMLGNGSNLKDRKLCVPLVEGKHSQSSFGRNEMAGDMLPLQREMNYDLGIDFHLLCTVYLVYSSAAIRT
jgi:hypothetical protein